MKNLLLLTSLLAICYFETATSACACVQTNDCSVAADGDVFADANDCSKYIVCYAGRAIRNTCPSGLMFDSSTQMCNPSRYVDCGSRQKTVATTPCAPVTPPCNTTPCVPPVTSPCNTTPRPPPVTSPCSTTPCTPPVNTPPCSSGPCTPPHHTTPCTPPNHTPPCTPPSHSTPCATTTCRPPHHTPTCSTTTCSTTACSETTTVAPEDRIYINRRSCQGLADGTLLHHPTNRRVYYECKAGTAYRNRCKLGQYFDYEKGKCRSAL